MPSSGSWPPATVVLVLIAPVTPTVTGVMCGRLAAWLDGSSTTAAVICDVTALTDADLAAVDTVARLYLTAARRGARLHLVGTGRALADLLTLTGLADVLDPTGTEIPH